MVADGLFSDPCHWNIDGTGSKDQPGDIDEGTTVDDLVNALRANTSYTSTAPTTVTVAGLAGVEIELTLPADDVLQTCDSSADEPTEHKYFVFGKGFWAQGANNIWRLFIIDVPGVKLNGTRLITMLNYFADTPQADVAAARAIVESFVITP
jgi:hypothetical protein